MNFVVAQLFSRDSRAFLEGQPAQPLFFGRIRARYACWIFLFITAIISQSFMRFRHGIGSFTPDDIMNLWVHSIRVSWQQEFMNCLTFSEPLDRSGAVLFYRLLFEIFHLNFLPFAITHAILLGVNSIIIFEVVRSLSTEKAALVATVLISRVPMFIDIYYSLATVYDVISSIFAWSAVFLWLKCLDQSRQIARLLRLKTLILLVQAAFLYQLSLASKELAIFPFIFAATLGVVRTPIGALCIFLLPSIQTIWFVIRKLNPANGMVQNGGYHWSGTPTLLWENSVWYFRWVTDFIVNTPSPAFVLLVTFFILIAVSFQRSIASVLSLISLFLAYLFILGLFRRNLYVFYILIPLVPIAFLQSFQKLNRFRWKALIVFVTALSVFQIWWCEYRWQRYGQIVAHMMKPAQIAIEYLNSNSLSVKRGGVVLVTNDPFPSKDYTVQMLLSLQFTDVGLTTLRVKFGEHKDSSTGFGKLYDAKIDLGGTESNTPK